jgi:hypothetical protein
MGGSKERLSDALFWRSRNNGLLGFEDYRVCNDHLGAAAQAIVTCILRLTLVLLINDIAVRVWQKIAGENLHRGEEDKKHRRAAKRFGPKAHFLYIATTDHAGN